MENLGMSETRQPNVTVDGEPAQMDLNGHEKLLEEALMFMESGRIGRAREEIQRALDRVRYFKHRKKTGHYRWVFQGELEDHLATGTGG
jgi:hypothetical protein